MRTDNISDATAKKYLGDIKLPLLIAEIGINHNGQIEIAKKLIDLAKSAGFDVVKFQKRNIDKVYSEEYLSSYRASPWGNTQREQKLALEFSEEQYDVIDDYCKSVGMPWFASAWDEDSQLFLRKYNLPFNKIASAMLSKEDFVDMVLDEGKLTFISTGMSHIDEIDDVVLKFREKSCPFVLMHCVSDYPCDDELLNLNTIELFKERYACLVGYSGHERGIVPSIIAASKYAVCIERHITLDRTLYGSDQAASLEEEGMLRLARDAKKIRDVMGDIDIRAKNRYIGNENEISKKLRYFE